MADDKGYAVVSHGANLQVKEFETDAEYMDVGGFVDFNGPQTSRGEIDKTTLRSSAKEFDLDLKDHGAFTASLQTIMGNPAQKLLIKGLDAAKPYHFRLSVPDDGYGNGPVHIEFAALVQSFPISGAVGQLVTTSLSLRITGDVKFVYPAP